MPLDQMTDPSTKRERGMADEKSHQEWGQDFNSPTLKKATSYRTHNPVAITEQLLCSMHEFILKRFAQVRSGHGHLGGAKYSGI
jgi:hypothetical protein